MPGKITLYVDSTSPFSYFAFVYLVEIQPLLAQHDISTDIVPIFLGGVMQFSGNKPPAQLPARGRYLRVDLKRAAKYHKTVELSSPPFFPMNSLLPQRCMTAIKQRYSRQRFEQVFEAAWRWVFVKHINLAEPPNMASFLVENGLSEAESQEIMKLASTKEVKDELVAKTKECCEERSAYGAPWFWLEKEEDGKPIAEPAFGSDRWAYIYQFFGLPFQDVALLPPDSAKL